MANGNGSKQGLKIVHLLSDRQDGNRYMLDEEALQRVLMRPDVRDLPVVLVSVAGAYRGGKSFILDFFLRYLTAPRSSQLSGEWLDKDHEQLQGFAWRGGSEPHTTGIHLWSEPVFVTQDNGEKVAVLLMDTQGTFDHDSTVGDNSTIFALSVLISSVQIYNLFSNIREDDLQHLQLFTEYGRIASDGKAFQKLLFLVRDWQNPHEHAYGFEGGEALLEKRLQMKDSQMAELREVRQHIRSCFESIKCFLMPHPGFVVREPSYEGRAKDLEEDFRTALKQLVPALFDPQHLVPKLIGGELVKGKHLLEFFKNYVELFNSKELPEAVTIFQATADACVASALRDAQDAYTAQMQCDVRDDFSVTTARLCQWHDVAVTAAFTAFDNKKKLGPQNSADAARAKLQEELDSRFSVYSLQNEATAAKSIAAAHKLYGDEVSKVCGQPGLVCLHPHDLDALHHRALSEALQSFEITRNMGGQDDEDKNRLEMNLKTTFAHLFTTNEQNNQNAIRKCREVFESKMRAQLNGATVTAEVLQSYREVAVLDAKNAFQSTRNIATKAPSDSHFDQLLQELEVKFEEYSTRNDHNNRVMVHGAEYTYQNFMATEWGPQASCFHPTGLAELHNSGKSKALLHYAGDRPLSESDGFRLELEQLIENRYKELVRINEVNNGQAVENAFSHYTHLMVQQLQVQPGGGGSNNELLTSTAPALVPLAVAGGPVAAIGALVSVVGLFGRRRSKPKRTPLSERHQFAKSAALQAWRSSRRGPEYPQDSYREQLEKKMEDASHRYN